MVPQLLLHKSLIFQPGTGSELGYDIISSKHVRTRTWRTRQESQLRVAFILSERETEFVSKVNKSVVTVRRGHFMNSVLLALRWYLFMCCWRFFGNLYGFVSSILIYQIYELGMSLQTCFSMFAYIISLREKIVHYWGKLVRGSLFGHT